MYESFIQNIYHNHSERRAREVRLVESCEAAMTKALAKMRNFWIWLKSPMIRQ